MATSIDNLFNKLSGSFWNAGVTFERTNPVPLEKYSVFQTYEKAADYALTNVVAYPGQPVAVVNETAVKLYYIDQNGKLVELGSAAGASGDLSALSVALSTDLSAEIVNRTKAIEDLSVALSTDLSNEAIVRETNDKALSDDYVKKIGDLSTSLSTDLSNEAIVRETNDKALSDDYVKKIGDLSTALSTDVKALSVALSTEISALKENSNEELKAVSVALSTDYVKKIGDLSTSLSTDIDTEIAARKANDTYLSGKVDDLSDGISADVKALSTALSTEISAETAARNAAVKALSIALSTDLSVENVRALSAEAKVLDDAKSYANGISTSLSTDYTEKIAALNDKLSSAWQFKGAKDLSAYSTLAEAQAAADPDPKNGDVIIINTKVDDGTTAAIEYAYDGSTWQQLGDESSNVSKYTLSVEIQKLSATVSAEIDHDVEALSTALSTDIDTEIAARKANDTYLSGKIDALSDGISADVKALSTALSTEISAETIARDNAVKALSVALSTDLSAEKIVRETNDKALSDDYVKKIGDLSTALSTDVKALSTALSTEISGLNSNADKKIEALSTALSTDIKALSVALSTEISAETKAREANDTFISGKVDELSSGISADVKALSVALSTEISAEALARAAAVDSEAAIRAAADAVLSTAIDSKIKAQIGDGANAISIDTLTIHKISQEKYAELLTSNAIVSTDLYVVSSDNMDVYGERIINVANGIDISDAVNVGQLSTVSADLQKQIDEAVKDGVESLSTRLSTDIKAISANLSTEIKTLSTQLSTEVKTLSTQLSTEVKTLSTQLSTEIKTLSTNLSTDIDKLSTNVYTNLSVAMTTAAGTGDILSSFTFTQGKETLGTINIPKDKVISGAYVVDVSGLKSGTELTAFEVSYDGIIQRTVEKAKDPDLFAAINQAYSGTGGGDGKYLRITVENDEALPIYIALPELVDTYTGAETDTVKVTVNANTRAISAEVKDESITTAKLADKAVTNDKLALSSVTSDNLSGIFLFDCGNVSSWSDGTEIPNA